MTILGKAYFTFLAIANVQNVFPLFLNDLLLVRRIRSLNVFLVNVDICYMAMQGTCSKLEKREWKFTHVSSNFVLMGIERKYV